MTRRIALLTVSLFLLTASSFAAPDLFMGVNGCYTWAAVSNWTREPGVENLPSGLGVGAQLSVGVKVHRLLEVLAGYAFSGYAGLPGSQAGPGIQNTAGGWRSGRAILGARATLAPPTDAPRPPVHIYAGGGLSMGGVARSVPARMDIHGNTIAFERELRSGSSVGFFIDVGLRFPLSDAAALGVGYLHHGYKARFYGDDHPGEWTIRSGAANFGLTYQF